MRNNIPEVLDVPNLSLQSVLDKPLITKMEVEVSAHTDKIKADQDYFTFVLEPTKIECSEMGRAPRMAWVQAIELHEKYFGGYEYGN